MLPYNNPVPNTYEPSDGNHPNFGPNTSTKDDANKGYNDINFFYLCGPGAADIAMWYWPAPPNLNNYAGVQDPKNTSQTTTWNATDIGGVTRMRGYLVHLAWQIQPPGWSQPGMMEQYAGGGTTLQTETQAMNWESSGEQTTNGFYVTTWWNQSSASLFHDDIASDITVNNVPVVAEVNTSYLQNWPSSRGGLNHFITIIGYDDSTGQYAYTDTCGGTTSCGSLYDAGIHWEPQSEMWNAVTSIQVNYNKGDGGWVW